jgi:DNA-binding winged helix-turn-helix (wHTH) protein
MTPLASGPIQFGSFELNPLAGELRKLGLRVRLTPQAMTLLCLLLESPVRMRTRDEIQERLWPANTFVDFQHSLNRGVHSLREALGDTASNPRFIETVAANGYRFLPQFAEHRPMTARTRSSDGADSVAVLPIETRHDEELLVVGGRLMSRLIDGLADTAGIRVLAEATVKSQKLEGMSPQRAGEMLGARIVLYGELQRCDDLLLLRTELIDTRDGAQICGAHARRMAQPGVHCDAELARSILRQIQPVLARSSAKSRMAPQPILVTERRNERSVREGHSR